MEIYVKVVNNFNYLKRICGLTILDRIVLSIYHARHKEVNVILSSDNSLNKKLKDYLAKRSYKFKINFLEEKDVKAKKHIIESNTVINEEYIKSLYDKDFTSSYAIVNFKIKKKEDEKMAENLLLKSCQKNDESIITKLYRFFSIRISKYLCRTFLTPNQITLSFCFISLLGALFMVSGVSFLYYLGILMQPLAIVIDCCDGEVARLKQHYGKNGDWIDTSCDNLCTLFFISAIAIVNYKVNHNSFNYYLGYFSVLFYVISITLMVFVQTMFEKGGSFKAINKRFKGTKSLLKAFIATILERAFVTLVFSILSLFYLTKLTLTMSVIGSLGLSIFLIIRILKEKSKKLN